MEMSTQEDYLVLLDLAYEVAQSLKGKPSENLYLPDCQQLAAKLFFHAATIYHLRQGTKVPVPYSVGGSDFYDFPSVTVLARSTLETYLTMFEVFLDPSTDDELEFEHALWQLSGFIIRERFRISDPELQSQAANARREIQTMRDRLQSTRKFASLGRGEKKDALKGKRRRDWATVAKAAGFGEQAMRQIYSYQSGYVHADGLSGAQIVGSTTAQDQIEFIETHMRTVMIVLSKMIVQYAAKFPEAEAVCSDKHDAFHVARAWSTAASLLP